MRSVYLIMSEDGRYKIGYSGNVSRRRMQLECASGLEMTVVSVFPTRYAELLESTLHRHFAEKRTIGEWFTLGEEEAAMFEEKCAKFDAAISKSFEGNILFKKTNKKWDRDENSGV